jgi:hypothetical protein
MKGVFGNDGALLFVLGGRGQFELDDRTVIARGRHFGVAHASRVLAIVSSRSRTFRPQATRVMEKFVAARTPQPTRETRVLPRNDDRVRSSFGRPIRTARVRQEKREGRLRFR